MFSPFKGTTSEVQKFVILHEEAFNDPFLVWLIMKYLAVIKVVGHCPTGVARKFQGMNCLRLELNFIFN